MIGNLCIFVQVPRKKVAFIYFKIIKVVKWTKEKKKHQTSFMQNYLDNKQKQKKKNPNRIVYLQIVENVFYYCCMRFDLHMCVQIKKKCQHKCANYDQSKQLWIILLFLNWDYFIYFAYAQVESAFTIHHHICFNIGRASCDSELATIFTITSPILFQSTVQHHSLDPFITSEINW